MAMTESEMAIRRLLNEPGFPTDRMTESQVSNEMLRDMEPDGQLDRARAEAMRKKLADQMFMDMRLRGASEFAGGRVANTGKPEDTSYAKADKAAALALRSQRANTQAEVDRRKRVPAAPDYTDERLREAMPIGFQPEANNKEAIVTAEADSIWERGRLEGHPISYEDARAVAADRTHRTLTSPAGTPGSIDYRQPDRRKMVGTDPDWQPKTEGSYADPTYAAAARSRLENMYGPLSPKPTAEPPPSTGPDPWSILNSPKATPVPPPESTDSGVPRRSARSEISDAATRALAKRRGRKEASR